MSGGVPSTSSLASALAPARRAASAPSSRACTPSNRSSTASARPSCPRSRRARPSARINAPGAFPATTSRSAASSTVASVLPDPRSSASVTGSSESGASSPDRLERLASAKLSGSARSASSSKRSASASSVNCGSAGHRAAAGPTRATNHRARARPSRGPSTARGAELDCPRSTTMRCAICSAWVTHSPGAPITLISALSARAAANSSRRRTARYALRTARRARVRRDPSASRSPSFSAA